MSFKKVTSLLMFNATLFMGVSSSQAHSHRDYRMDNDGQEALRSSSTERQEELIVIEVDEPMELAQGDLMETPIMGDAQRENQLAQESRERRSEYFRRRPQQAPQRERSLLRRSFRGRNPAVVVLRNRD